MPTVARPMMVSVMTSVFLRPMRSPMWANTTPPTGRIRKASAKEASDSIWLATGSADGKKSGAKTMLAIVPYRK